ncbi:hypothetical protein [Palaeococcus ferrophilus]|uniref:hypothetical protein n=1 Tax=Palaeococcus ferrophilus TaxID=83868 RepID=UPI00064E1CBB|nr:hypothetical protein [Palaeococcus ferrophilus]
MRFRVKSRETMRELSKELSKAGIMNRTEERLEREVRYWVLVSGKLEELEELAGGVPAVAEALEEFVEAYERLEVGEVVGGEDGVSPSLVETLHGAGLIDGEGKLLEKPPLGSLTVNLLLPAEELDEELEGARLRAAVRFTMAHYVEVLEVDGELVERALDIAEGYVDEDELEEATLVGLAESVLAETVMESLKEDNRKDALIARVMESVPITLEDEDELRVEIDEESLEEFLKHLQRLGYLKVKGNKIWW